ncbi:hypothetical protein TNCV_770681 [Trichonephila clavipes]|nr:hypothetical protein TNCV_770681 [Trichonephila clavipes]
MISQVQCRWSPCVLLRSLIWCSYSEITTWSKVPCGKSNLDNHTAQQSSVGSNHIAGKPGIGIRGMRKNRRMA